MIRLYIIIINSKSFILFNKIHITGKESQLDIDM